MNYDNNNIFFSIFGNPEKFLEEIKIELFPLSGNKVDSYLYQQGKNAGLNLHFDINSAKIAIEKRYDSYNELLKKLVATNHETNRVEVESNIANLESDLRKLEEEFDENNQENKINRIKAKIKSIEGKIEDYKKKINESDFINSFQEVHQHRINEDIKEIDRLIAEKKELHDVLMIEVAKLKELLNGINFSIKDIEDIQKKINEIKTILKEFPFFVTEETKDKNYIYLSKRYTNPIFKRINNLTDIIEEKYSNLNHNLRDGKPFISPFFHIILYYLITFLIVFGEVYFVYMFIGKIAGFSERSPMIEKVFRLLFSLSYPLAIGYSFKYYISSTENKQKTRRELFSLLKNLVYIAIGCAALNVSADILKKNEEFSSSLLISNNVLLYLNFLLKAFFYATLTFLFSIIGSFSLTETFSLHRQHYNHYRRNGLTRRLFNFKFNSNEILTEFEKEKNDLEKEIEKLFDKKREINEKIAKWKAKRKYYETPPCDYKDLIEGFKHLAISIFLDGYNVGKAEYFKDKQEDKFLIYNLLENYKNEN